MDNNNNILKHIKLKQKNELPPNFFENLHAKLIEEIKDHPKQNKFYNQPFFWIASIAASLIAIFVLNNFSNINKHQIAEQKTLEKIIDTPKVKTQLIDSIKKDTLEIRKKIVKQMKTNLSLEDELKNISEEELLEYINNNELEEDIENLIFD